MRLAVHRSSAVRRAQYHAALSQRHCCAVRGAIRAPSQRHYCNTPSRITRAVPSYVVAPSPRCACACSVTHLRMLGPVYALGKKWRLAVEATLARPFNISRAWHRSSARSVCEKHKISVHKDKITHPHHAHYFRAFRFLRVPLSSFRAKVSALRALTSRAHAHAQ